MAEKKKISRKKKKESKRKKNFKNNDSSKNKKSSTLSANLPQNDENFQSSFNEEKKPNKQIAPPQKNKKNNFSIFYSKKYLLLEITSLLLITFILYSGTLDHSFHFDDAANIWSNPNIQISNLSIDGLRKAGFDSVNNQRPVANISFALNYYLHGLEVRGYHYVNIFIHLLTGIILYYFLKVTLNLPCHKDRYNKSQFISFFTALIWLVHPLHIQSVTYIVQRMNSMAALFYILIWKSFSQK